MTNKKQSEVYKYLFGVMGVFIILNLGTLLYFIFTVEQVNEVQGIKILMITLLMSNLAFAFFLYKSFRFEILYFSERITFLIDGIISEKEVVFDDNKETLLSKIENKLKNLQNCLYLKNSIIKEERDSIKSLIGDISHQIKTPISSINLYSETLLRNKLSINESDEFISLISEQVKKIEWLIESLFKVSRLENGVIEIMKKNNSLKDVLASCISDLYIKAIDKEIDIIVDFENDIILNFDFKWTKELVLNIIDNAIKYSPNESKIKIKVVQQEMFTRIDIIDNGIGILKADINNIFKRFFRAEEVNEIEGAGVGLYLSRYIIEKQGGFITVKSENFKGSTFSIYFSNEI
ncbi:MAG: sensor histidine kinase [Sarcina sp.]